MEMSKHVWDGDLKMIIKTKKLDLNGREIKILTKCLKFLTDLADYTTTTSYITSWILQELICLL